VVKFLPRDTSGPPARNLAREAGIADVRARLLPEDKVTAVRKLEAAGRKVLLAGDGVNDAPALAAASTGEAMGRVGSDLALDAADLVIMRDDVPAVPAVIIGLDGPLLLRASTWPAEAQGL
jgi:P-type E1-E2 ATPase